MDLVQFVLEITLGIVQFCVKHPHTDTDTDWKQIGIKKWCLSNCCSALRIFSSDNSFLKCDVGHILGQEEEVGDCVRKCELSRQSPVYHFHTSKTQVSPSSHHRGWGWLSERVTQGLQLLIPGEPNGAAQLHSGHWTGRNAERKETKWRNFPKDCFFLVSERWGRNICLYGSVNLWALILCVSPL